MMDSCNLPDYSERTVRRAGVIQQEKIMGQSLDVFMAELRKNADDFEAAYRKKAAENPEQYPLIIPDDNAGLWLEFFMGFVQTGET